ncbi:uncharacterized protein A4U43_UnF11700 [Asparagus officinalis]|uniref:Uncharacterized protein n=1 Tax=Asparagus officinalis TaxID=4686 RepID=A0A1R3L579_ASPOF|nr:uncharacterized protein A4U43_UnF11700 [Asparagus officinalis]
MAIMNCRDQLSGGTCRQMIEMGLKQRMVRVDLIRDPIRIMARKIKNCGRRIGDHPAHHLDVKGSVLSSRLTQSRAVEQFWLPQDEEFLKGVPNFGLHQNLQSYLVRGALVEQEIFGRMEQIRTSYLKLLGEITSLRAGREVNSERIAETPAPRDSGVDGLKRELEESKKKARRLDEALQERDRAKVQVEAEK